MQVPRRAEVAASLEWSQKSVRKGEKETERGGGGGMLAQGNLEGKPLDTGAWEKCPPQSCTIVRWYLSNCTNTSSTAGAWSLQHSRGGNGGNSAPRCSSCEAAGSARCTQRRATAQRCMQQPARAAREHSKAQRSAARRPWRDQAAPTKGGEHDGKGLEGSQHCGAGRGTQSRRQLSATPSSARCSSSSGVCARRCWFSAAQHRQGGCAPACPRRLCAGVGLADRSWSQ